MYIPSSLGAHYIHPPPPTLRILAIITDGQLHSITWNRRHTRTTECCPLKEDRVRHAHTTPAAHHAPGRMCIFPASCVPFSSTLLPPMVLARVKVPLKLQLQVGIHKRRGGEGRGGGGGVGGGEWEEQGA